MSTTTYPAYAGEFSSDDDFETNQRAATTQQQSKWNKFDTEDKASPEAIEAAIVSLRSLPIDADYELSDELIAGGLDRYKAQRGPIVDSTRRLYKKILLRAIKEETVAKNDGSNDDEDQPIITDQLNGEKISSTNYKNESSSSAKKVLQLQHRAKNIEDYSSDDDDYMIEQNAARLDQDKDVEMMTKGDVNSPQFRSTKLIEISSDSETEEDNDESSEDDDDDDDTQEDQDDTNKAEYKRSDKIHSDNATHASIGGISTSNAINKTARLRKLAGTSHSKEESFEKPTVTRSVTFKRRPTTRSQLSPNSSRTSLDEDKQASSSTVNQKDTLVTPRRLNPLSFIMKCIIFALVLYCSYRFYRSLSADQPKGFRARLPNSIQF